MPLQPLSWHSSAGKLFIIFDNARPIFRHLTIQRGKNVRLETIINQHHTKHKTYIILIGRESMNLFRDRIVKGSVPE